MVEGAWAPAPCHVSDVQVLRGAWAPCEVSGCVTDCCGLPVSLQLQTDCITCTASPDSVVGLAAERLQKAAMGFCSIGS